MSQAKVIILLYELGGRAKSSAIVQRAKEKYRGENLWEIVGTRLSKMREWGDVSYDNNTQEWYITSQGMETVKHLLAQSA